MRGSSDGSTVDKKPVDKKTAVSRAAEKMP